MESKVDFTLLDVDTTQYSLEDDQNLFTVLTSFSNYVTERTTKIQREVNETSEAAKRLDVKIGNTFNDFLRLANTQFIENRVYEEDDSDTKAAAEGEEKVSSNNEGLPEDEATVVNRYKHALGAGYKAMNLFLYEEDDLSDEPVALAFASRLEDRVFHALVARSTVLSQPSLHTTTTNTGSGALV